jgi:hypothetical protein
MLRDTDMRRLLKRHLADVHAKDADTRIVDELGLRQGAVRVDVAVINGALHGYELKSDFDTLQRLSSQVQTYSDVLDEAALVTTVEHAQREAVAMVPEWWHVLLIDGEPSDPHIHTVRNGSSNPAINVRALVELLWHDEALQLLRARGADRGLARKPRRHAWDALVQAYAVDELREIVRGRLKRGVAGRKADARPS